MIKVHCIIKGLFFFIPFDSRTINRKFNFFFTIFIRVWSGWTSSLLLKVWASYYKQLLNHWPIVTNNLDSLWFFSFVYCSSIQVAAIAASTIKLMNCHRHSKIKTGKQFDGVWIGSSPLGYFLRRISACCHKIHQISLFQTGEFTAALFNLPREEKRSKSDFTIK